MDDEQFQQISKALADPRRREILEMVAAKCRDSAADEPLVCRMLVERLPIGQPTVSHHVHALAKAGLIEIHSEHPYNRLTLREDTAAAYVAELRRRLRLEGG